MKRIKLRT